MVRSVRLSAVIVGLVAVAALLGASGSASAFGLQIPYGFSTPTGSFVVPYWQNILSSDPVTPDTLVFGDTLYIEFFDALGNRTVTVSTFQFGDGQTNISYNQSFSVVGRDITLLTYDMPSSTMERNVRLCVDGGCMTFAHASPITLIPSGILTIGGLDLLAFGITAEFGLLLFPAIVGARALARKALWFPKFKAWLVAPHIALGFLLLIGLDYRAFDELFSGLGFLFIPVVFVALFFLWALHLFNVATPVYATRAEPNGGRELTEYRWRFFVGQMPDGRLVLVGCYWRDAFARLFGHAPVLFDPADRTRVDGGPLAARIVNMRLETNDEKADRFTRMMRRRQRELPSAAHALDQFKTINVGGTRLNPRERDPPALHYYVDSDGWLNATMPKLSLHRIVREPEVKSSTGEVVKPARTVRKLSWPHYVESSGAETSLAGLHYLAVPSVPSLLWVAVERAWRRVGQVRIQNFALRTTPFVLADEATEVVGGELFTLLERERFPLTDIEADEDTRSEGPKKAAPTAEDDESANLDRLPSGQKKVGAGGKP